MLLGPNRVPGGDREISLWTMLPVLSLALAAVYAPPGRYGFPSGKATGNVLRVFTPCVHSHLGPLVWGCWVRVDENLSFGNLSSTQGYLVLS